MQTATYVCQLDRVELELVIELDLDLNPAAPVCPPLITTLCSRTGAKARARKSL